MIDLSERVFVGMELETILKNAMMAILLMEMDETQTEKLNLDILAQARLRQLKIFAQKIMLYGRNMMKLKKHHSV